MNEYERLKKQKDEILAKEPIFNQVRLLRMMNQDLKDELEGANNLLEQYKNGSRVAMLERLLEKQTKDNEMSSHNHALYAGELREEIISFKSTVDIQKSQLETYKEAIEALVEDHRNQKAKSDDWIQKIETEARGYMKQVESQKEYWEGYSEESIRIESQLRDQIQSQNEELKRIEEHVKPLYHSTDKETHLIACRVLRDPDRYPPKLDEHRFA
jgi:hypothetical protein